MCQGDVFSHVSNVSYLFGQDFITTLATDEKGQILLRLLSQSRGCLGYAKNIQAEINDSAEPDPGHLCLVYGYCQSCIWPVSVETLSCMNV